MSKDEARKNERTPIKAILVPADDIHIKAGQDGSKTAQQIRIAREIVNKAKTQVQNEEKKST